MCGRYASFTPADVYAEILDAVNRAGPVEPRYNIAPTDGVLACRPGSQGGRELVTLRWGLVPFWAKDPQTGYRMINARAETVASKPAFRAAFRRRRCLIPADGFYEWKREGRARQPYFIRLRDAAPMAFAGLWEHWEGHDGLVIESTTIIVTEANALVSGLHDRMPVIVPPDDYGRWLDTDADEGTLTGLLQPYPAEAMESYRVGQAVNRPGNEGPGLIERIG